MIHIKFNFISTTNAIQFDPIKLKFKYKINKKKIKGIDYKVNT